MMVEAGKRVALYARVSTTNHGQDIGMQMHELREYCERLGLQIVGEYKDVGVSGAKDRRPGLDKLMADAKQRRFDVVCVWKLDRFGRSLRHLVNALVDLESCGVSFISIKDNLDLSTATGRLMFQIIGAMSEFEHALIVERVKAGLRYTRSQGTTLGRPAHTPITPELIAEVQRAKPQLIAKRLSYRTLASRLGVSTMTVWKIANPDRVRSATK